METWNILNNVLGDSIQIVGDDLTVTNPVLLQKSIDEKAMNAILIKLNQIEQCQRLLLQSLKLKLIILTILFRTDLAKLKIHLCRLTEHINGDKLKQVRYAGQIELQSIINY